MKSSNTNTVRAGESPKEIQAFLESERFRGQSKFAPFEKTIFILLANGSTQRGVVRWLAADPRNIVATQSELSKWLALAERRDIKFAKKAEFEKRAGTRDLFEDEDQRPSARLPVSVAPPSHLATQFSYPAAATPAPATRAQVHMTAKPEPYQVPATVTRSSNPLPVRQATSTPVHASLKPKNKSLPYQLSDGSIQMPDGSKLTQPLRKDYGVDETAFGQDMNAYRKICDQAYDNVLKTRATKRLQQ